MWSGLDFSVWDMLTVISFGCAITTEVHLVKPDEFKIKDFILWELEEKLDETD